MMLVNYKGYIINLDWITSIYDGDVPDRYNNPQKYLIINFRNSETIYINEFYFDEFTKAIKKDLPKDYKKGILWK